MEDFTEDITEDIKVFLSSPQSFELVEKAETKTVVRKKKRKTISKKLLIKNILMEQDLSKLTMRQQILNQKFRQTLGELDDISLINSGIDLVPYNINNKSSLESFARNCSIGETEEAKRIKKETKTNKEGRTNEEGGSNKEKKTYRGGMISDSKAKASRKRRKVVSRTKLGLMYYNKLYEDSIASPSSVRSSKKYVIKLDKITTINDIYIIRIPLPQETVITPEPYKEKECPLNKEEDPNLVNTRDETHLMNETTEELSEKGMLPSFNTQSVLDDSFKIRISYKIKESPFDRLTIKLKMGDSGTPKEEQTSHGLFVDESHKENFYQEENQKDETIDEQEIENTIESNEKSIFEDVALSFFDVTTVSITEESKDYQLEESHYESTEINKDIKQSEETSIPEADSSNADVVIQTVDEDSKQSEETSIPETDSSNTDVVIQTVDENMDIQKDSIDLKEESFRDTPDNLMTSLDEHIMLEDINNVGSLMDEVKIDMPNSCEVLFNKEDGENVFKYEQDEDIHQRENLDDPSDFVMTPCDEMNITELVLIEETNTVEPFINSSVIITSLDEEVKKTPTDEVEHNKEYSNNWILMDEVEISKGILMDEVEINNGDLMDEVEVNMTESTVNSTAFVLSFDGEVKENEVEITSNAIMSQDFYQKIVQNDLILRQNIPALCFSEDLTTSVSDKKEITFNCENNQNVPSEILDKDIETSNQCDEENVIPEEKEFKTGNASQSEIEEEDVQHTSFMTSNINIINEEILSTTQDYSVEGPTHESANRNCFMKFSMYLEIIQIYLKSHKCDLSKLLVPFLKLFFQKINDLECMCDIEKDLIDLLEKIEECNGCG